MPFASGAVHTPAPAVSRQNESSEHTVVHGWPSVGNAALIHGLHEAFLALGVFAGALDLEQV